MRTKKGQSLLQHHKKAAEIIPRTNSNQTANAGEKLFSLLMIQQKILKLRRVLSDRKKPKIQRICRQSLTSLNFFEN